METHQHPHLHTCLPSPPSPTQQTPAHASNHRHITHTFDGADDLVQVFGVVAVRSTARADLQRVVRSIFCEKLKHTHHSHYLWIFFKTVSFLLLQHSTLTSAHSHCSREPKNTLSSLSPFKTMQLLSWKISGSVYTLANQIGKMTCDEYLHRLSGSINVLN